MKNIRINRKIISTLFAGAILISLSGCNKKTQEINEENKIGHIDIQKPKDILSTHFIYYNVGNHKEIGVSRQDELLAKCKENDISRGIIINSDASTRLEIYEDVEYTKSVIENSDIDLPVYFDINNIVENDDLSMTEKSDLIFEYINLIRKNNIYVGVYGTSTNLNTLNQYGLPISNTVDSFIKEDGITKYNGMSSIKEDLEGNITSNCDIVKNLNVKMGQNGYSIVDETNDLTKISMQHDISINDLLKYNNKEKKDITPGTVLRIPNEIQRRIEYVYPDLERSQTVLYRGIDISYCQELNENVDFKKISKNIDFAILKISEQMDKEYTSLREDPKFEKFYKQCTESDMYVGGYYITNATTVGEAVKEAELVLDRIKGLNFTFPIFIDYENIIETEYEEQFNQIKEMNSMGEIIPAVKKVFKDYRFGIYSNLSTYSEIEQMVDSKDLNECSIWLSHPDPELKSITQLLDNGPICKSLNGRYSYGCDIIQVSESIRDLGIGNANGCVDVDYCYVNFDTPKIPQELPPEYVFETKQYKRKDPRKVVKTASRIAGVTSGFLFTVYVIGHKKRKKYIKRIVKKIH